ncbi:MAG: AzlD domain-containing protein [Sphingomonadaceae bacterium]
MEGKVAFVLAMMLATYPVRLAPMLALSARKLPDRLVRWLHYVPPAVFAALVFPGLLLRDGAPAITPSNGHLWAGAATLAVILATHNLSKAVGAGIAVALLGELVLR